MRHTHLLKTSRIQAMTAYAGSPQVGDLLAQYDTLSSAGKAMRPRYGGLTNRSLYQGGSRL